MKLLCWNKNSNSVKTSKTEIHTNSKFEISRWKILYKLVKVFLYKKQTDDEVVTETKVSWPVQDHVHSEWI